MDFSSPACMLHDPPISCSMIRFSPETWKRSTYHEGPCYAISLASSHFLSLRSEYSLYSASSVFIGLLLQIMFYSYSKSQKDSLFLNFILVKNCTCFIQIYCPSSGVIILYLQQLVFVILMMLNVCQTVNITSMTNTYCCVYSVELLLMMDSRCVRNM